MTAQDVADGRMRVTVLLAVVRPAEFHEITLEQMMVAGT
jgi:phage tail sheath protein FI